MASDPPPVEDPATSQPSPTTSTKKARRQTAFYPNVNSSNKPQKPFSRSAAKRESVMALGSIEHLQYYFTKTGLTAKQNPLKPNSNLVPAIGPGVIQVDTSAQDHSFILPPSPMAPPPLRPYLPPLVKTYQTDPDMLKPGVIEDVESVERVWCLGVHAYQPRDPELLGGDTPHTGNFDVLSTLKTTTRAIRSVRDYLMALPGDFAASMLRDHEFRPHSLSPLSGAARKVSRSGSPNDPLSLVRRSALDVLTVLRNLEEASRVPLSDDAYDAQSDAGSSFSREQTPSGAERVASPFTSTSGDEEESDASFSVSIVHVQSRQGSVPVWGDGDEDETDDETSEKREHWDERLVLGGGWLYKQDISLESLTREREAVKIYLDAVDQVLFGGSEVENDRGWRREKVRLTTEKERQAKAHKGRSASAGDGENQLLSQKGGRGRRVVSAGMVDSMRGMVVSEEPDEILQSVTEEAEDEDDGVEDSLLPDWAKRSKFSEDPLGRTLSLLVTFLPPDLLPLLPSPSAFSRDALFLALSSGQILCTAYNAAVRKSRKPWGYINRMAIHDVASLEAGETSSGGDAEKKKKGWTFRRTDNLRLWAAALKLRYLLPLVLPRSQEGSPIASPSTSQISFPSVEPPLPLLFDPQLVARHEEGWDKMLEAAVSQWVRCVVEEQRKGK